MYSEAQREMRRCKKIKSDGERCKGYAKIDGKYCALHSYDRKATKLPKAHEREAARARRAKRRAQPQKRFTCNCSAYPFPHRLSSGTCRFPGSPAARKPNPIQRRAVERSKAQPHVTREWESVINNKRDVEPAYDGASEADALNEKERHSTPNVAVSDDLPVCTHEDPLVRKLINAQIEERERQMAVIPAITRRLWETE